MAETPTPPPPQDSKPQFPNPENPSSRPPNAESQSDSALSQLPPPPAQLAANPNSVPALAVPPSQPILINQYAPPPSFPSFRPAGAPTAQFTPVSTTPNFPSYQPQGPGVPPPGVSSALGMVAPSQMVPGGMYQVPPPGQPPNPLVRPPYVTMPNGFMPPGVHPGTIPPPGVLHYPYQSMVRPAFPLRPPGTVGVIPQISRPPMLGIRPPVITSIVRPPVLPMVSLFEKPQTTVYVGKIATTVENDFMLSLLQFCGAVKSWKRPQDPSNGTPKAFGFCEFESAEGALRAVRLLSKVNIDGQELVLNVAKKKETPKPTGTEEKGTKEEDIKKVEKTEGEPKPGEEDKNESGSKENDVMSDEDREADREATEKITQTIEERIRNRPLPPPPPLPQKIDVTATPNSEGPTKSGEKDSDLDVKKDEKNDDEMTSEIKASTRAGTESPERGRRYDGRGREREKREKERELERIERERERERARREREREVEIQKAERLYKERVKEWEVREKEREYQRKYDKEREKEKERERRRLVQDQEDESDDDSRRRRRRSEIEEKRKKRQREKEEDLADRLREEEEIVEANKLAEEQRKHQLEAEALRLSLGLEANGNEKAMSPDRVSSEIQEKGTELTFDGYSAPTTHNGEGTTENGSNDETATITDSRPSGNSAPAKKLGFGLSGSGKRTAVHSLFKEEDDDDAHKDKKMRPLVPIDYSAEELQGALPNTAVSPPPNPSLDGVKRSSTSSKDEAEKERSRHRSSHRDHTDNKSKNSEHKNVIDAKQLIDMIPKTKEELFSYDINWAIYDKHGLQDRMRPWIVKKITEFLGEEEATLVDYIVSSIQDHVKAPQMLELLQSILDEEAEMFVLKMWRMLIFEIKRVETGLASKPKA